MNFVAFTIPFFALFYILIMKKYIELIVDKKIESISGYIIWGIYFAYQIEIRINPNIPVSIKLVLNVLFIFLICKIAYKENVRKKGLFLVTICAVWMIVEIIVNTLFILLSIDDMAGMLGEVTSMLLMLCLFAMLRKYLHKSIIILPLEYTILLLCVPAGSIYIMNNIYVQAKNKNELFLFISGAIFLIINYIVLDVYHNVALQMETRRNNIIYKQQLELWKEQIAEREQTNLETRRVRHDMKEHLVSILGMVENRNIDLLENYIKSLINSSLDNSPDQISNTGNIVVDSLVNYKYSVARKENIEFESELFFPSDLPFQGEHLTIILGNLLTNAIEACRKIEAKRYIRLSIVYRKKTLSIVIENSCNDSETSNKQNRFFTTKEDSDMHGLGLYSVEKAVKEYNGELSIQKISKGLASKFIVVVILYEKGE